MRSEFNLIQTLKDRFSLRHVGDDCAVLPKNDVTDMVVTADMLVENIDFRLDWTTAELLGHKALAVSLSDLAAMGGKPIWAMTSLGVPEQLWASDFVDRFYDGWHKLAAKYDVELVGGDISRTPDKLVIDSIVGGDVPKGKAILRSGARPGDSIYVTGALGGSATGLHMLRRNNRLDTAKTETERLVLLKHLEPTPRLDSAEILQSNSLATAMIDLSDGLSSDLSHLIAASGVGARIYMDEVPRDTRVFIPATSETEFERALHGGEDFELLFTADEKKLSDGKLVSFHRIGQITANIGIIELIVGGKTEILEPKGYRHF